MVRFGEMMVVVRAQDYASRTLHKVAGEVAGMQRMQRMQMRAQKQYIPQLRQEARLLNNLSNATKAHAAAQAKSNAQRFNTTRAGRVFRREVIAAEKELKQFQRTMTAPMAIRGMDTAGVERLGLAIRRLDAERLHRIGSAMSGLGRTMQLFGAVGVVGFGLAANSFAKFSASAATAGTQMRDLNAPMAQAVARSKELQEAILEMAMVFPNSSQDMTDAAYEIFSSMNLMHNGVMNVQGGLQLLAVANKAAVAGQVNLSEATNAMIVALNIFDPQLQDVKGTMDEVFNIVRFGKIHLDDLSHVFTQFASAAHAAGMSLKDIGAAFATLTLFQDPGKASAGLGRLIELLRTPQFKEGLKNLVDVDIIIPETGKMKPLLQIMQEIVKARPDLAESRKAAIDFFIELTKASGKTKVGVQGTVQARRSFETFATHMDTFAETVAHVRGNYNEMNKAFQARMTDPGVQWELFKNRMKALAIVIGQQVLPVFITIGNWIAGAIRWFKGLNEGVRGSFLRFAAWAAVITLAGGVVLSMGGSIVQLIATMQLLRIAALQTGTAFITMRTMMIATGIGAIIVAFGVAAVLVIQHWNAVRAFFQAFGEELKSNWEDVMQKVGGITLKGVAAILNPLYQLEKRVPGVGRYAKFIGPLNLATAGLEKAGDAMMESGDMSNFWDRYSELVKKFGKDSNKATDWLKDFKSIVGKFDGQMLSEEYKKWANSVGKTTEEAAQRAKDHAQAVKQATDNMNQTIKTATTNLVNLYEQMQQANQTALGGLFQGPTMQGILGNVFKNINDNLRQFGVQIPVPFAILKQDLDQSLTYFKRWRQGINTLLKRGVPHEMLAELQAMGPEGIPIIEGLLAAPSGQFRGIIRMYKKGQALTDKATKEDMARKLKYWESFGKDAAFATIMGIISSPKNAKIATMYENYVKNTYGAILKKTFQDDVAEYMANALAMAKAQAEQSNVFGAMPPLFATPPKKGSRAELAAMTPQQLTKVAAQNAQKISALMNFVGPLTPIQQRNLTNLRRRRQAIMAEYRRDAAPVAARQIARQRAQGRETYTITYAGDTITIQADGATVAAVTRALQKKHFTQKNKHKKGTASKVFQGNR